MTSLVDGSCRSGGEVQLVKANLYLNNAKQLVAFPGLKSRDKSKEVKYIKCVLSN